VAAQGARSGAQGVRGRGTGRALTTGIEIPPHLAALVERNGDRAIDPGWLDRLPALVEELATAWDLELDAPIGDPPAPAGWLAPGRRRADGRPVMFKATWPHPEAATEAAGLRHFAGRGAAHLLHADEGRFVVVTELVRPGHDLWTVTDPDEADDLAMRVLRRLWHPPPPATPIATLADEVAGWRLEGAVARRAAALLATLAPDDLVVVHGDYNPSNVLASDDGWVVIDPKPLVGEPAYDLAQYLANHVGRATPDEVRGRIERLAARAGLDPARVAGWAAVKAVGWSWGEDLAARFAAAADALNCPS
jgi:streptomycin 6-kinase